ncbi:hypothetical protein V8E53_009718 [Lactarius tabidus]
MVHNGINPKEPGNLVILLRRWEQKKYTPIGFQPSKSHSSPQITLSIPLSQGWERALCLADVLLLLGLSPPSEHYAPDGNHLPWKRAADIGTTFGAIPLLVATVSSVVAFLRSIGGLPGNSVIVFVAAVVSPTPPDMPQDGSPGLLGHAAANVRSAGGTTTHLSVGGTLTQSRHGHIPVMIVAEVDGYRSVRSQPALDTTIGLGKFQRRGSGQKERF